MTANRARLRVERLDTRALPGGVTHHAVGHGSYTFDAKPGDTGHADQLHGSLHIDGEGDFALNGSVHTVGSAQGGHATGRLVLSNAQGTRTIALDGPAQAAFAPLPVTFTFTVVGGTGAYAHKTGHGTLQLHLGPAHAVGQTVHRYGSFDITA